MLLDWSFFRTAVSDVTFAVGTMRTYMLWDYANVTVNESESILHKGNAIGSLITYLKISLKILTFVEARSYAPEVNTFTGLCQPSVECR